MAVASGEETPHCALLWRFCTDHRPHGGTNFHVLLALGANLHLIDFDLVVEAIGVNRVGCVEADPRQSCLSRRQSINNLPSSIPCCFRLTVDAHMSITNGKPILACSRALQSY